MEQYILIKVPLYFGAFQREVQVLQRLLKKSPSCVCVCVGGGGERVLFQRKHRLSELPASADNVCPELGTMAAELSSSSSTFLAAPSIFTSPEKCFVFSTVKYSSPDARLDKLLPTAHNGA
jgi:hypothetical protein